MPGHNFLQQAGGRATSPGSKESTRPTLGGIEPTDYATRNIFANSVPAGATGGRRDVRGSAGSPERAAVERPRPTEQAPCGIAARSCSRCTKGSGTPAAGQGPREGASSGQSTGKDGGEKTCKATCRKTGRGKSFRSAP